MDSRNARAAAHPLGEDKLQPGTARQAAADEPLLVDTQGGRYHVHWDDSAPATPLGQLVFFAQFLNAGELFSRLCADAPFQFTSPNAPQVPDVLGTLLLSILAGHHRYAHLNALRFDAVTPPLLGMQKIVSEDSARRALQKVDQLRARAWQQRHLRAVWEPLLYEPWVLDVDTTVKTIYGKQEGAQVGYNPHKPGRPSHTYHTYWIGRLRLCLDVEVRPGKEHAGKYGMPGLWELLDSLPRAAWPHLLRGDCNYGNEANMREAEARGLGYLFKLRQTSKAKELIRFLETQGGWREVGLGLEGLEGTLRLSGWSCARRVVVARRRKAPPATTAPPQGQRLLALSGGCTLESAVYEYTVLVTSLPYELGAITQLYRERADSENPFDELKNQWGWAGFTTRDFERCQLMARLIALGYNWWSLFVRLVDRERHREAVTSRPMLLGGVARQSHHAGQTHLRVSLTHAKSVQIQAKLTRASRFLQALITAAEQLAQPERWRRMLAHIFEKYLDGRPLGGPLPALASG
jgi:Transposase DDE domain group 1